jgi:hypothetical protein
MSEATKSLSELLSDAEALIGLLLDTYRLLLPEELHQPILVAWPRNRKRFALVRAILDQPTPSLEKGLEEVGLSGDDLALKVAGYGRARRELDMAVAIPKPPRGLGWLFQRVLAWLNIVLGSLSTVIPGAEAIKEFKDSIENGIEDKARGKESR